MKLKKKTFILGSVSALTLGVPVALVVACGNSTETNETNQANALPSNFFNEIILSNGTLDSNYSIDGWVISIVAEDSDMTIDKLVSNQAYRVKMVLQDGFLPPSNLGDLTEDSNNLGTYYSSVIVRAEQFASQLVVSELIDEYGNFNSDYDTAGWLNVNLVLNSSKNAVSKINAGEDYYFYIRLEDGYSFPDLEDAWIPDNNGIVFRTAVSTFIEQAVDIEVENLVVVNDGTLDQTSIPRGWTVKLIDPSDDSLIFGPLTSGQSYKFEIEVNSNFYALTLDSTWIQVAAESNIYRNTQINTFLPTATSPQLENWVDFEGVIDQTLAPTGWEAKLIDPDTGQEITTEIRENGVRYIYQITLIEGYYLPTISSDWTSLQNDPNVYRSEIQTWSLTASNLVAFDLIDEYGNFNLDYDTTGWENVNLIRRIGSSTTEVSKINGGETYYFYARVADGYSLPNFEDGWNKDSDNGRIYRSTFTQFDEQAADIEVDNLVVVNDGTIDQTSIPRGWTVRLIDSGDDFLISDPLTLGRSYKFEIEVNSDFYVPTLDATWIQDPTDSNIYRSTQINTFSPSADSPQLGNWFNYEGVIDQTFLPFGWEFELINPDTDQEITTEIRENGVRYIYQITLIEGYSLPTISSDWTSFQNDPNVYRSEIQTWTLTASNLVASDLIDEYGNFNLDYDTTGWLDVNLIRRIGSNASQVSKINGGEVYYFYVLLANGYSLPNFEDGWNQDPVNGRLYRSTFTQFNEQAADIEVENLVVVNDGTIDQTSIPQGWTVRFIDSSDDSVISGPLTSGQSYKFEIEVNSNFYALTLDATWIQDTTDSNIYRSTQINTFLPIATSPQFGNWITLEGAIDQSFIPNGWEVRLIDIDTNQEITTEIKESGVRYVYQITLIEGYSLPTISSDWISFQGDSNVYRSEIQTSAVASNLVVADLVDGYGNFNLDYDTTGWEIVNLIRRIGADTSQVSEINAGESYYFFIQLRDGYTLPNLDLNDWVPDSNGIVFRTAVSTFVEQAADIEVDNLVFVNDGTIDQTSIPRGWTVRFIDSSDDSLISGSLTVGQSYKFEIEVDSNFYAPTLDSTWIQDTTDLNIYRSTQVNTFSPAATSPQLGNWINFEGTIDQTLIPNGWEVRLIDPDTNQEITTRIRENGVQYIYQITLIEGYFLPTISSDWTSFQGNSNVYRSEIQTWTLTGSNLVASELLDEYGNFNLDYDTTGWEIVNLIRRIGADTSQVSKINAGETYYFYVLLADGYSLPNFEDGWTQDPGNGKLYRSTFTQFIEEAADIEFGNLIVVNDGTIDQTSIPRGWTVRFINSSDDSLITSPLTLGQSYKFEIEVDSNFYAPTLDETWIQDTTDLNIYRSTQVNTFSPVATSPQFGNWFDYEGAINQTLIPTGWEFGLIDPDTNQEITTRIAENGVRYVYQITLIEGYFLPTISSDWTSFQGNSNVYRSEIQTWTLTASNLVASELLDEYGNFNLDYDTTGWLDVNLVRGSGGAATQVSKINSGESYYFYIRLEDGYSLPNLDLNDWVQDSNGIVFRTMASAFVEQAADIEIDNLVLVNDGTIDQTSIPRGWTIRFIDSSDDSLISGSLTAGQSYKFEIEVDSNFYAPNLDSTWIQDTTDSNIYRNTQINTFSPIATSPQFGNWINFEGTIDQTLIPIGWEAKLIDPDTNQEITTGIKENGVQYVYQITLIEGYSLPPISSLLTSFQGDSNVYRSAVQTLAVASNLVASDLIDVYGNFNLDYDTTGWEIVNLIRGSGGAATQVSKINAGEDYYFYIQLEDGYSLPNLDLNDWVQDSNGIVFRTTVSTFSEQAADIEVENLVVVNDGTIDQTSIPRGWTVRFIDSSDNSLISDPLTSGQSYKFEIEVNGNFYAPTLDSTWIQDATDSNIYRSTESFTFN